MAGRVDARGHVQPYECRHELERQRGGRFIRRDVRLLSDEDSAAIAAGGEAVRNDFQHTARGALAALDEAKALQDARARLAELRRGIESYRASVQSLEADDSPAGLVERLSEIDDLRRALGHLGKQVAVRQQEEQDKANAFRTAGRGLAYRVRQSWRGNQLAIADDESRDMAERDVARWAATLLGEASMDNTLVEEVLARLAPPVLVTPPAGPADPAPSWLAGPRDLSPTPYVRRTVPAAAVWNALDAPGGPPAAGNPARDFSAYAVPDAQKAAGAVRTAPEAVGPSGDPPTAPGPANAAEGVVS